MKIKIAEGLYPIVDDGEYTDRHFLLVDNNKDHFRFDGELIVPGFARIETNGQVAMIEVTRKDYIKA